jgi:hypothetical protein
MLSLETRNPAPRSSFFFFLVTGAMFEGSEQQQQQTSSAVERGRFSKGAKVRQTSRQTNGREQDQGSTRRSPTRNPFATPVGCAVMTSLVAPAAHFRGRPSQDVENPSSPLLAT